MKKTSRIFIILTLILSHLMCIVVSSNYTAMLCGIEHQGFSAPASTAFLYAIPFVAGIIICIALAFVLKRRADKR